MNLLAASGMGGVGFWVIYIVVIIAFMYFIAIRPQRKQQKALDEMRKALTKGDKVITVGGIYGTIAEVDETSVLIKVDGDVKLRVDKNSVQKDTTPAK